MFGASVVQPQDERCIRPSARASACAERSQDRALGQAQKGVVRLSTFPQVGKAESEAGLALTKESLKAAYQYDKLINKLSALREK